jgi:hypothetical protein
LLPETRTAGIGSVSSAADYYRRDLPLDFLSRFDRLWKEQISATWREQHQEAQSSQKRLRELCFRTNVSMSRWINISIL